MKLYVIRHGETSANEEGRLQGWSDDPLNPNGIRLAEQTGRALKGLRFDKAFSSPLSRALDTVKIVLRESGNGSLDVRVDERLKEINAGIYERRTIRGENREVDPDFCRGFFTNPFLVGGFPGGESVRAVMDRTQGFLREICRDEEANILVSTHGFALRAMLNFLYDDPSNSWHGHVPYNCAVSIVDFSRGRLKLEADDRIFYDRSMLVDRYADQA